MTLLYINKNINLSKPIIDQLTEMGFQVDVLIESLPPAIDRLSIVHRLQNIFSRLIFNDKNYFINKEKKLFERLAEKRLENKKYDIAFFIRADMYSERLIKKVRKQSEKMVSYQWDGLEMYPRIFDFYKYFDRKLVFDSDDVRRFSEFSLLPLSNFHYSKTAKKSKAEFDFFYVGVGLEERIKWIELIEKYCKENGKILKAILTIPDFRQERLTDSLSLVHQGISLEENEKYASRSKVIIDFKMASHNGASFRVFECLQREQKLISNNHTLRDYDFYHPDNIFITDFGNLEGLQEFLETPYHTIDRKIVDKYGIKNWLKYALDEGDYEPINLP